MSLYFEFFNYLFFTKKKIIWTIVILAVVVPIGYRLLKGSNPADKIQSEIVKKQDLKQTVLATGQVVSTTDLQLSFKGCLLYTSDAADE